MEKISSSHIDTRTRLPKFFVEHIVNICNQAGIRMNRLELLDYSSAVGTQLWYVGSAQDVLGNRCHYVVQFNSFGAFLSLSSYSDSEFIKISVPALIVR